MYDLKNQRFVVLAFATVGNIHDNSKGGYTHFLHREEIIEISAVKIECGIIKDSFHSFVAIDGIDSHNLQFEPGNYGSYRATPELLIGSPSFSDLIEKIYAFIGDSIIIDISSSIINQLQFFKDKASSLGYLINNPVLSMWHIHKAKVLQKRLRANDKKFENLSTLQIAQMFTTKDARWTDIFAEYDIDFNPEGKDIDDIGRNDPLSWALAFAKLFIALVEDDNYSALEPIDEEYPF